MPAADSRDLVFYTQCQPRKRNAAHAKLVMPAKAVHVSQRENNIVPVAGQKN